MLLQLKNTDQSNIGKLLAYAKQMNIEIEMIDDQPDKYHLPGKPLSPEQLKALVEQSRNSGIISTQEAHQSIRNSYHED
jgi:hypothetical protein